MSGVTMDFSLTTDSPVFTTAQQKLLKCLTVEDRARVLTRVRVSMWQGQPAQRELFLASGLSDALLFRLIDESYDCYDCVDRSALTATERGAVRQLWEQRGAVGWWKVAVDAHYMLELPMSLVGPFVECLGDSDVDPKERLLDRLARGGASWPMARALVKTASKYDWDMAIVRRGESQGWGSRRKLSDKGSVALYRLWEQGGFRVDMEGLFRLHYSSKCQLSIIWPLIQDWAAVREKRRESLHRTVQRSAGEGRAML